MNILSLLTDTIVLFFYILIFTSISGYDFIFSSFIRYNPKNIFDYYFFGLTVLFLLGFTIYLIIGFNEYFNLFFMLL